MGESADRSVWLVVDGLRPAAQRDGLSVAAKLDCACVALEFARDALANGLPRDCGKGRLPMKARDELVLIAIRNALELISGGSL